MLGSKIKHHWGSRPWSQKHNQAKFRGMLARTWLLTSTGAPYPRPPASSIASHGIGFGMSCFLWRGFRRQVSNYSLIVEAVLAQHHFSSLLTSRWFILIIWVRWTISFWFSCPQFVLTNNMPIYRQNHGHLCFPKGNKIAARIRCSCRRDHHLDRQ